MKYANTPSLKIKINPSKKLVAVLVFIHALALFSVFWFMFPVVLRMIFLPIIAISFLYHWRKDYKLQTAKSIVEISGTQTQWLLTTASGAQIITQLQSGTLVTTALIVLQTKDTLTQKHWSIPIFNDAADKDKLRQLRVLLRQLKVQHLPTTGLKHE